MAKQAQPSTYLASVGATALMFGVGAVSLILPVVVPEAPKVQAIAEAAAVAGAKELASEEPNASGRSIVAAIDVARVGGLRLFPSDIEFGFWNGSSFEVDTRGKVNAIQVNVRKFVLDPGYAQIILRFDAQTLHGTAVATAKDGQLVGNAP